MEVSKEQLGILLCYIKNIQKTLVGVHSLPVLGSNGEAVNIKILDETEHHFIIDNVSLAEEAIRELLPVDPNGSHADENEDDIPEEQQVETLDNVVALDIEGSSEMKLAASSY